MKTYLIYGYGTSGKALYDLLHKENAVFVYDDNSSISQITFNRALSLLPVTTCLILSPGVSPSSLLCNIARGLGVVVVGEFEFTASKCLATQIAVTGTNGKTTTTEMLYHILRTSGAPAYLLGNGGVSFCSVSLQRSDIAVLEVSSFQLENYNDYRPKISAITNLAPDHINRHGSYERYVNAKLNVAKSQTAADYTLLNYDDEQLKILKNALKSNVITYSASNESADCFCRGSKIFCKISDQFYEIPSNVEHYVTHNISNMVCAVTICVILGVGKEKISNAISTYKLLPHRLEYVTQIDNVKFYNDSKATNVHACLSALNNFDKVCLIVGGSDKGETFDEIFAHKTKLVFVACYGATSKRILNSASKAGYANIEVYQDLFTAVKSCFEVARTASATVLYSPACASFDNFTNYKVRGDCFKNTVTQLYEDFYI